MTETGIDILAISTHPDDAELACGGTLCLAAREGLAVLIADLTAGEASTRGNVETRGNEAAEAASRLGIGGRVSVGLPDTAVADTLAQAEAVVRIIRSCRPRIVLIPFAKDRHPDHVAASALCRRAIFLARLPHVAGGPTHRVDKVLEYPGHHPMDPTLVVDVSDHWEQRMHALSAYASQFGTADGPQTALSDGSFLRYIEARAIHYGAMIGVRYGEGFRTDGPVAIRSVKDLRPDDNRHYRCYL